MGRSGPPGLYVCQTEDEYQLARKQVEEEHRREDEWFDAYEEYLARRRSQPG